MKMKIVKRKKIMLLLLCSVLVLPLQVPQDFYFFHIFNVDASVNYACTFGGDAWQTVVSTRLHHTIFFEHDDEGKRITLSAAWVNPRFEPGPWCEEISEVIG
jgi:hypothetical protein